ncbi:FAD-dependent pyridine nucleotide-disulfide oxidoreductase family protein, rhodanese homology domain-containing [Syntrophotalea carbinolica DSM 2380]|uniref:FAD-dependent pyridine nucleotide-disulfide oxidoreductase family protein, rhodanese homology domain-containing n=1 Tax=Syntrophotalea carbinolica (strain DSM 2380 / NBRC 103641 / GraBd1) TaxID=338963 RepID=Q3A484_SYNC1|nr:FAD-dependent oxidoreductase [Syntrophotalea carbinolica]ABA88823.1 FAD-dependent pyridine nucleotide-disulfide oxidoreductase family protein, rhodanese homology domain-containing [Syntrophotalea carbinolica DSM 2380]
MDKKKHIVVIGGSAAGPKTAARAKRLDQDAEVTIIQMAPELSMASCGYPYFVGGVFNDRNQLLSTPYGEVRDPDFFWNTKGITARTSTEVTAIDREKRLVTCRNLETNDIDQVPYDKLVIATGATARKPPLPGIDLEGVTTLQSMKDADFLRKIRDDKDITNAVVIGGGLIGIETCEALQLSGIDITVVELLPQILMFLDWELAKILENHVKSKAANVLTDIGVAEFIGKDGKLTAVKLANGTELPCNLAVMAIGVQPNTRLADEAGLKIGPTGGIEVNPFMQTTDPNIYAVGDCVEINHRITGARTRAPFGDLANLQGRVTGENVVLGNTAQFPGTIHTGICKVFDFSAGSTGLSEANAKAAGYENIVTVINASLDKPEFMGAKLLISKLVADGRTGKILGVQCVGPGDVSKQIATAAMAILGNLTVHDLVNADLPYAPPFSLPIDHFIASAHLLENKMKGRLNGISSLEMKKLLDSESTPFILDVRTPDEYNMMRIGIGETLIPISDLRNRLQDLPQDKDQEIVCYCKISLRGYEAQRLLEAHGWKNVKVLEGGVMAWPFGREK